MTLLDDLQTTIAGVAERLGPSVVGLGRGWAAGSGVIVADGQVATVAHAVRRGEPTVTFADGRRAEATVAGVDRDANLAILAVDTADAPAVELGDERPGVGAAVLALADPGARGLRASLGFVTVAERGLRGPRGRRLRGAIEHSAPLPRGSSGGPLADAEGRVLGLNAIRLEGGLILAVPLTADLVTRLAAGERVEPRRLGVALAPPHVARRMRRAVGLPEIEGLLVRGARDGSPADRAGIRRGDLILTDLDALHAAIDSGAPTVDLEIVRGAEELTVTVAFDADVETV
jgi:serine protease Do